MPRRARMPLGIETEYAVLDNGVGSGRERIAHELIKQARRYAHLCDESRSSVFLACGGRYYCDAGAHPEMSSAECQDPFQLVQYAETGDAIVERCAHRVEAEGNPGLRVCKSNVDLAGNVTSWGSHESYGVHHTMRQLADDLVPFLVTRIVFAGAGGFDNRWPGLSFLLSPKAPHIVGITGDASTHDRPLVHSRDEPLAGNGWKRLHLICGESLMSQRSLFLRVGTTALVLAAIEAGERPSLVCKLADPLAALRTIAADPTCRAVVPLQGFGKASAINIQEIYLACVESAEARGALPPWAGRVIAEWRSVLADLEHAPDAVATSLDWAIRHSIYRQRAARCGLDWQVLQWASEGCVQAREHSRLTGVPDHLLDQTGGREWKTTASEVHPSLRRRLADFNTLRGELYETDIRFGQLGDGVFRRLDEAGVLAHRIQGVGDVADAFDKGPEGTRAALRSHWIRKLAGKPGFVCTWDQIVNTVDGSRLDMPDPFDADLTREFAPRRRRRNRLLVDQDPFLNLLGLGI